MMVGLRMLDGVRAEDFRSQFNCAIEEVFGAGHRSLMPLRTARAYRGRLSAQPAGLLFGNDVFGAFIGSANSPRRKEISSNNNCMFILNHVYLSLYLHRDEVS